MKFPNLNFYVYRPGINLFLRGIFEIVFTILKRIEHNYLIVIIALFVSADISLHAQNNRVHYAGKNIFISGMNVAWVNFAGDIGPNPPNISQFQNIFKTVHENGGNVMRLWLNTNGAQTPVFNDTGKVIGPGTNAIQYLENILSAAQQNDIGLQLCLWSHDMMNISEINSTELDRNEKLLTDTAYTMAYIRNALIPMVSALKGNPAIVGWEVFNEPEGFSNEFGWSGDAHVPMLDIQRCVNLIAGAIHRTDSTALVTSGANTIQTLTDVNPIAKTSTAAYLNSLSSLQKIELAKGFNRAHRTNLTTGQVISYLNKLAALPDSNYYRDDRLIRAGGDSMGTLDYYNVHFYGTVDMSPFNHTYSYWQLDKPLVAGEFYVQDTYGVSWQNLYETLFQNGYAGAMSWSWSDNYQGVQISRSEQLMEELFQSHRYAVIINPTTGSIYNFSLDAATIQKGDSTVLRWITEPGSMVTLDGTAVVDSNSLVVSPNITTTYTLISKGQVTDSAMVKLTVQPTGYIISYKAVPTQVGPGESSTLIWQVVKGSSVTLNEQNVPASDSLKVFPDSTHNTYLLVASGDITDSISITIPVLPVDQIDRALKASVAVSSNDTDTYSLSKPENINDGSTLTRWQAAPGSGQWVQIDLGKSISINKVVIRWGNNDYARRYSLQVSNDIINWQVIAGTTSGNGGTNGVEILDNLQGQGRYLKLLLQLPGSGVTAFSIAEIEVYGSVVTGINGKKVEPIIYSLKQNYPNPFNPSTYINFSIAKYSFVNLTVYNILGQKVAALVNKEMPAGNYSVRFNGANLSSGVYLYVLKSDDFIKTKKMILLK